MRSSYVLYNFLGEGATSKTYRVIHKQSHIEYAAKIVNRQRIKNAQSLLNERNYHAIVTRASQTRYPKPAPIAHLHDHFSDDSHVVFILDYCEGGTLESQAFAQDDPFDENQAIIAMAPIADALEVCHSMNVVFGDVKPQNILLRRKNALESTCLCDFGSSLYVSSPFTGGVAFKGTPRFMAREIWDMRRGCRGERKGYGQSVDVFAFGVTCIWLLTHDFPFHINLDNCGGNENVITTNYRCFDDFRKKCSTAEFRNMVFACVQDDPTKRPTTAALHDFFENAAQSTLL